MRGEEPYIVKTSFATVSIKDKLPKNVQKGLRKLIQYFFYIFSLTIKVNYQYNLLSDPEVIHLKNII